VQDISKDTLAGVCAFLRCGLGCFSKLQISSSKHQRKHQAPTSKTARASVLQLEVWGFSGAWSLEFGASLSRIPPAQAHNVITLVQQPRPPAHIGVRTILIIHDGKPPSTISASRQAIAPGAQCQPAGQPNDDGIQQREIAENPPPASSHENPLPQKLQALDFHTKIPAQHGFGPGRQRGRMAFSMSAKTHTLQFFAQGRGLGRWRRPKRKAAPSIFPAVTAAPWPGQRPWSCAHVPKPAGAGRDVRTGWAAPDLPGSAGIFSAVLRTSASRISSAVLPEN